MQLSFSLLVENRGKTADDHGKNSTYLQERKSTGKCHPKTF